MTRKSVWPSKDLTGHLILAGHYLNPVICFLDEYQWWPHQRKCAALNKLFFFVPLVKGHQENTDLHFKPFQSLQNFAVKPLPAARGFTFVLNILTSFLWCGK